MTIEAAKGSGIFKSHQAIKVENENPTAILALKIETTPPPGVSEVPIITGAVVGRPRLSASEEKE